METKKKKQKLSLKLDQKVRQLRALEAALSKARKVEKSARYYGPKRKCAEELSKYLSVPLLSYKRIRDAEAFSTKSYNYGQQVLDLVHHLFVKYPVPEFLYRLVLTPEGRKLVFGEPARSSRRASSAPMQEWDQGLFFVAAQGGSVAKILARYLTKKEAHLFMQGPSCYSVLENMGWAKMRAAAIAPNVIQHLMARLVVGHASWVLTEKCDDILRFYSAEGSKMNPRQLREVTDYIVGMWSDSTFKLKGRTLKSVMKLSAIWHRLNYWGVVREYQSWPRTYANWQFKDETQSVRMVELTDNRQLHDESHKQRHCVYIYTSDCVNNESKIVSFRWFETLEMGPTIIARRVTVEISVQRKAVVQVRGVANRRASEEEERVVRKWAYSQELEVSSWAF